MSLEDFIINYFSHTSEKMGFQSSIGITYFYNFLPIEIQINQLLYLCLHLF